MKLITAGPKSKRRQSGQSYPVSGQEDVLAMAISVLSNTECRKLVCTCMTPAGMTMNHEFTDRPGLDQCD